MLNPVGGNRGIDRPIGEISKREKTGKERTQRETDRKKGVIVDISTPGGVVDQDLETKIELIKRRIREGNYPLDRTRLAEKILDFFTDGGR